MLETIFWIIVGMFIGWNFPQPEYAKSFQQNVMFLFILKVVIVKTTMAC